MRSPGSSFDPDIRHRRSVRLKGYDYSWAGAYFVTVCAYERGQLFGRMVEGHVQSSKVGELVKQEWERTIIVRQNVRRDAFIVMPDHFHAIMNLTDMCKGTARRAPTIERFGRPTRDSIPTIVRAFKSAATKKINESRNSPGAPVWQRNYYEHIIRNETELAEIREYIKYNAQKLSPSGVSPLIQVSDIWNQRSA